MARRSYDHYCPVARGLDVVGDRWALLIVRELLAGPCRYTDLHADLPGISTDMLAARLRDLEQAEVVVRRKLSRPGTVTVYELTDRGRALQPTLTALADWGASELAEPRPTDAVRAHWLAIPLIARLDAVTNGRTRTVNVTLDEGTFHVRLGDTEVSYGDGAAERPDVELTMDTGTCLALIREQLTFTDAVRDRAVRVVGDDIFDAA